MLVVILRRNDGWQCGSAAVNSKEAKGDILTEVAGWLCMVTSLTGSKLVGQTGEANVGGHSCC